MAGRNDAGRNSWAPPAAMRHITIQEAMRALPLSYAQWLRLIHMGIIPAVKFGVGRARFLIAVQDLEALVHQWRYRAVKVSVRKAPGAAGAGTPARPPTTVKKP